MGKISEKTKRELEEAITEVGKSAAKKAHREKWIVAIIALVLLGAGVAYYFVNPYIVERVDVQNVYKDKPGFWRDLPKEERDQLAAYGFVLFPKIFGSDYKIKYRRYIEWLLDKHGVTNANIKNVYSATGLKDFKIGNQVYSEIPGVFTTFENHSDEVFKIIETASTGDLTQYWDKVPDDFESRVWYWYSLIEPHANETLDRQPFDLEGFIK